MITKYNKERLVRYLGPQYGAKVCERLQQKGILNRHGQPYTSTAVRTILNNRNHQDIENTVLELVDENELQKKLAQRLQHLQHQKQTA